MKNLLLSEVNVLCLHFSAKSMPAKAEDVVCCKNGGKKNHNKKKDGVAVKGGGDCKLIKWLHPQAVQSGWHFPQFYGLLCCNGRSAC